MAHADEARRDALLSILRDHPNSRTALTELGTLEFDDGEWEKTIRLLKKATIVGVRTGPIFRMLGIAHWHVFLATLNSGESLANRERTQENLEQAELNLTRASNFSMAKQDFSSTDSMKESLEKQAGFFSV